MGQLISHVGQTEEPGPGASAVESHPGPYWLPGHLRRRRRVPRKGAAVQQELDQYLLLSGKCLGSAGRKAHEFCCQSTIWEPWLLLATWECQELNESGTFCMQNKSSTTELQPLSTLRVLHTLKDHPLKQWITFLHVTSCLFRLKQRQRCSSISCEKAAHRHQHQK